MIKNQWYDEGVLAYKLGKAISDCPYKEFSYGYAQWCMGYTHSLECIV